MSLEIYLNSGELVTVSIDEKTVLTKKIMNDDTLQAHFTTNKVIPIGLGSYTLVNGVRYYINQLPSIKKENTNTFHYTAIFQGKLHKLKEKTLFSSDGLLEYSYVGTPSDFIIMIVASINTIQSGWSVGTVASATKLKIDFYNDTCYSALFKVAQAFHMEFQLVDQAIHLQTSVGTIKTLTFEYGQHNGTYKIERRIIANAPHYTRVYGYGSTKNIPYTYRNRAKRLIFEEKYLQKETAAFGIKEGVFIDETIYPNRTSTLTAVSQVFNAGVFDNGLSYFTDANLDFDINDYLLEGLIAKLVFKSGELSGYEYEIWKYDAATKRIYINALTENDAYVTPNESLKAAVGDEYTLVNIDMPPSYVITAEAALKAATQRFLDNNCIPKTMYILELDQKHIKDNSIVLNEGDIVTIKDAQLGVDRPIRIVQISYPYVNPNKITAQIADEIPYLRKQLESLKLQRTNETVSAITNTTNITTVNNSTSETYVFDDPQQIEINSRKFKFIKDFDNAVNLTTLEINDVIFGNFWDRFTLVKKWKYLGGEIAVRANYEEIETLEKLIV